MHLHEVMNRQSESLERNASLVLLGWEALYYFFFLIEEGCFLSGRFMVTHSLVGSWDVTAVCDVTASCDFLCIYPLP